MATEQILYFNGYGAEGDCGISTGGYNAIPKYTPCKNKEITKVFCGHSQSIYSNNDLSKIWSAGSNIYGECGVGSKYNKQNMITTYTPITYFNQNQIKIKSICKNNCSRHSFFISDEDKLYACGQNNLAQLGWNKQEIKQHINIKSYQDTKFRKFEPELIADLTNVIDAKSNGQYSIALCLINTEKFTKIIANWCRLHKAPSDIITLLLLYTKTSIVYSTTKASGSGHRVRDKLPNPFGWNQIMALKNTNIIKIGVASLFSVFLDDNGVIWGCGGDTGETIGDKWIPQKIYDDNKIVDIACGEYHGLALDENGKVYAFGENYEGQCGFGQYDISDFIATPTLIEGLKEYVIDRIKCGRSHSFVHTVCDKWFAFGGNEYDECMAKKRGSGRIFEPVRIDDIVKKTLNTSCIVDIFPGYCNTKIFCLKQ